MPYQHFSIWDKELNDFFVNLEKQDIDSTNLKTWFYENGPLVIHKSETSTLSLYLKNHLQANKCFPTLSDAGLGGYMVQVLQHVLKEFFEFFEDMQDAEFKDIIVKQYAVFTIAAFNNHLEFYAWRAELSTVKMSEFIKQTLKPDFEAQTRFVEEEILKALQNTEITAALRTDLQDFLTYAREINFQMTPLTKKRGVYAEKSENREQQRDRFQEPNKYSPLSIQRMLSGGKVPSSHTTGEIKDESHDNQPPARTLGLKS
jgi:hypothetical protein